jgi:hypothetical protein
MYARVNIIFGDRSKVDAGIAHLEDTDRDVVEATRGNRGLTTLADRPAGVVVAISYWDEPLHSSEAALTRARQDAAAAAGGDLVVERYEVAISERRSAPARGAAVRMARVQIGPSRIEDGIAFIRTEILPSMRTVDGFCSAELLIDPSAGNGVFISAWDNDLGAVRSDNILDARRDEAVERVAVKFPRTEFYAVVRAVGPDD